MTYKNGRAWFSKSERGAKFDRYDLIGGFCGGIIADVACGCGYGTSILARNGIMAHGYDADASAIEFAKDNWSEDRVSFSILDLNKEELPGMYDCVVSCETIEHLAAPIPETLAMFARHILPNGKMCLTFPEQEKGPKDHHVHFGICLADVSEMLAGMGFRMLHQETRHGGSIVIAELEASS